MDMKRFEPYESLILRIFLGLTLVFWGYEKMTVLKLTKSYPMDYGTLFSFVDVGLYLKFFGVLQIVMGLTMILGLLTRTSAAILALMAISTIVVPGMIIIKDVPHFAYAFATAGGALVLLIRGSGRYSLSAVLSGRH
jgi:uncharacterized membrane protein YphA (DoxX/SURF4 family)